MFIHLRHYWHKMADVLEYGAVQWLDTPDICMCDVSPTLKTLEQSIFVSTRVTVFIVKTWRSDNRDDRTDDMAVLLQYELQYKRPYWGVQSEEN